METLNIYLMRHGKVDAAPGLHGQSDLKVKESEQQDIAQAWKEQGREVSGIITSTLSRCSDVAEIIGEQQMLPVSENSELREMNFGDFDGVPFDMLNDNWKN